MAKLEDIKKEAILANMSNQERFLYSIAISLKRIADSLEKPEVTLMSSNLGLTPEQVQSLQEKWNKGS